MVREPMLTMVAIADLRPTQITVGMREVMAKRKRRHYKDIPKSVTALVDDPFRSLAGELRRAGGYAKETTPFSEFLWADFLRRRMKRKRVEGDFDRAIAKALKLAKSMDANYLPGWCGPT